MYGEAYTSDIFLHLQEEVRNLRPPTDKMEYIVFPFMEFSDGTHLASFGTASLEATYGWSGLLSKYIRERPGSFSAEHQLYSPTVRTVQELLLCLIPNLQSAPRFICGLVLCNF